jgi:hypothetical protein
VFIFVISGILEVEIGLVQGPIAAEKADLVKKSS